MAKRKEEQAEEPTSVTTPLDDDSIQAEAFAPADRLESNDPLSAGDTLGAARWVLALEEKTDAMADAAQRLDAAYEAENWDDALAAANELIEAAPTQGRAYLFRGMIYTEREAMEDAMADFDKAAELTPESADLYVQRGRARYAAEDTEGSIRDFKYALKLDPKYAPAYMERGYAFFSKGAVEAALSDFKNYTKLDPQNPVGYNNQAFVAMWMGRTTAAEQLWRKATSFPDSPHWAFAGHAISLWRMKKRKDALTQYRKAVAEEPRWRDNLEEVSAEFSWPPAMTTIAQEIIARLDAE